MVAEIWRTELGSLAGQFAEAPPSTMGEVYEASRRATVTGHGLTAEGYSLEQALDERLDAIRKATGVTRENPLREPIQMEMTPEEQWRDMGPIGRHSIPSPTDNRLGRFRQWLGQMREQFPDHRELFDDFDAEQIAGRAARDNERTFQSVSERGPGGGGTLLASLAGGFVGAMQDPVQAIAAIAAPGAGAGRSLLYHATKSAAINAGIEAGIQPWVQDWRRRAGLEYGVGKALEDILMAGVAGGAIDVIGRGGLRVVRGDTASQILRGKGDPPDTRIAQPADTAGALPEPRSADPVEALDMAARELPEGHPIREAAEGRPEALAAEIERLGNRAPPELRAAAQRADDGVLFGAPDGVDEIAHIEALAQAVRRAVAPEIEPPSFVPERTPELQRMVEDGAAPEGLADLVSRTSPPDRQVEMMQMLLERAPGSEEAARRLIAERLERPGARQPDGVEQTRIGARGFDEPTGEAARLQTDALMAEMGPRIRPERAAAEAPEGQAGRAAEADGAAGRAAAEARPGDGAPMRGAAEVRSEIGRIAAEMAPMLPRGATVRSFRDLGDLPGFTGTLGQRGDRVVSRASGQAEVERQALVERAEAVRQEVRGVMGLVPSDFEVKVFAGVGDLPPAAAAEVARANAGRFTEALSAFQRATTDAERMAARRAMDLAQSNRTVEALVADDVIWVAAYAMNPAGKVAHESVHALVKSGRLTPDEMRLLAEDARRLGVFDEAREAMYRSSYQERPNVTPTRLAEMLEEEAAAHRLEVEKNRRAMMGGAEPEPKAAEVDGIIARVQAFLGQVRDAITRAMGRTEQATPAPQADPVKGLLDALLAGEIAKREPVMRAMRAEDISAMVVKPDKAVADRIMTSRVEMVRAEIERLEADATLIPGSFARTDADVELAIRAAMERADPDSLLDESITDDMIAAAKADPDGFRAGAWKELRPGIIAEMKEFVRSQAMRAEDISAMAVRSDAGPMMAMADAETGRSMRRDLDALGYYSQALEAARALKQAKGTPEQMLAQLKSAGVKDAEIEATGLDKFFAEKAKGSRPEPGARGPEAEATGASRVLAETPEYKRAEADAVKAFNDDIEANKYVYFEDRIEYDDNGDMLPLDDLYPSLNGRDWAEFPATAASAVEAGARALGYDLVLTRGNSSSHYGTITINGRQRKVRVADHERQSNLHDGADYNISPESMTPFEFFERLIADARPKQKATAPSITRDEIVAHLEQNRVGLSEVVRHRSKADEKVQDRDTYQRLAGEVEARAVQKRMDMTPEQRRSRPPWEDYDVPESEQIVRFASENSPSMFAFSSPPPVEGFPTVKETKGGIMFAIRAFHGSPHDFDRFDMSKIGTGEGAQAFGHGLYFAENEGVARSYQNTLGRTHNLGTWASQSTVDGAPYTAKNPAHLAAFYKGNYGKDALATAEAELAGHEMQRQLAQEFGQPDPGPNDTVVKAVEILKSGNVPKWQGPGRLYEVRINANADDFLDWDRPLSQQSQRVRSSLESFDPTTTLYDDTYKTGDVINQVRGGKGEVEQKLREAGIPGIRYLDQGSRTAGEGSRNYVVFDDSLIEIIAKDGQPVSTQERSNVVGGMTAKPDGGPMFALRAFHATDQVIDRFDPAKATGRHGGAMGGMYFSERADVSGPRGKWTSGIIGDYGRAFVHEVDIDDTRGPILDIMKPFSKQTPEAQALLRKGEDTIRRDFVSMGDYVFTNGEKFDVTSPEHFASARLFNRKNRTDAIAGIKQQAQEADTRAKRRFFEKAARVIEDGQELTVDVFADDVPLWNLGYPDYRALGFDIIRVSDDEMVVFNPDLITIRNVQEVGPDGGPMFAMAEVESATRAALDMADADEAAARLLRGGAPGAAPVAVGGDAAAGGQPMFAFSSGGMRAAVEAAVSAQAMSREQADEVMGIYDRFLRQHRLAYGDAEAQRRAQIDTAEKLEAEAAQRRRAALLQAKSAEVLDTEMFSHKNARGEIDPAQFLWMVLESSGETADGPRAGSVEGRRKALIGAAHARFEQALYEFRTSAFAGRRMNKARLENVAREAFGEDTGDAAANGIAKAWGEIAEDFRQRYNELGGAIGKRDDWGLPQRHDAAKMLAAGFQRWREDQLRLLAPERMTDQLTGKPMTVDDIEDALRHAWESITSDGWAHVDPSMQPKGRGSLVRQHAESRFFVYKNADAWLEYQRLYGEGDIFATMMGHFNVMSRDVAAMTVLGPNPDATREWMKQSVMKEAQAARRGEPARFPTRGELMGREIANPVDYANRMIKASDDMWAHMRGAAGTPVNTFAATVVGAGRNIVTGMALTGSSLSAIATDPFIQKATRMFAGVEGRFGRNAFGFDLINEIVTQMRGSSRREAVRAGLILDSAMNVMREEARGLGYLGGPEWSRWFVDRVLTLNGLTGLTQAEKHAFGLSFMSTGADYGGVQIAKMPAPFARTLGRYGFDDADWALMSLARRHDMSADGSGATILRPLEIRQVTPDQIRAELLRGAKRDMIDLGRVLTPDEMAIFRGEKPMPPPALEGRTSIPSDPPDVKVARYMRDLSERYHGMIIQETVRAVPEAKVRGRAAIISDVQPGTLVGEALRSAAMFKSFGVTMAMLHMGQVIREHASGWKPGTAGYAAALAIGLPIGGALAIHLKSIRDGRDPDSMASGEFWLRAMAQGGGWGIYGDFILADTNRMGGSWSSTVAGPMVGRAENIWNLTAGNFRQFSSNKDTNVGAEATRFIRQNTPFANLPYTKLAWDRIFMDELQRRIDPNAARAWRRMETDARKKGSAFFWPPGQDLQRGPSLRGILTPPPPR